MNLHLTNSVAFITASTKGIGYACAESLLSEGAKVIISSRNENNVRLATEILSEKYGKESVYSKAVDYTNNQEMLRFYKDSTQVFGKINILVCNSGGPKPATALNLLDDEIQKGLENNLVSAIRITNLILPEMIKRKSGRIIYITSTGVIQPIDGLALSNIARSGLTAYAKTLSNEVAQNNITVNCVLPGKTETDRQQELLIMKSTINGVTLSEQKEMELSQIPAKRFGKAEEIASMVTFISSSNAAYLTGNNIAVDGGILKSIH